MEWAGLIEMGVVFLFAMGWGVLELYTLHLDKKKAREKAEREAQQPPPPQS